MDDQNHPGVVEALLPLISIALLLPAWSRPPLARQSGPNLSCSANTVAVESQPN